jgi:hypothetical protein
MSMPKMHSVMRVCLYILCSVPWASVDWGATGVSEPTKHEEGLSPPGFTMARTGDVHDFDYFAGAWTTKQHRLKARGTGSTQWDDFPATLCLNPYLGGAATVDELYLPTKGRSGLTLRLFDQTAQQWSIYWVNSATGKLDPVPVVGGFSGNHGEFYAMDQEDERPIKVRYMWNKIDHEHAHWEQAFSYDDRTWETNWTAEFARADSASTCEAGRPRH